MVAPGRRDRRPATDTPATGRPASTAPSPATGRDTGPAAPAAVTAINTCSSRQRRSPPQAQPSSVSIRTLLHPEEAVKARHGRQQPAGGRRANDTGVAARDGAGARQRSPPCVRRCTALRGCQHRRGGTGGLSRASPGRSWSRSPLARATYARVAPRRISAGYSLLGWHDTLMVVLAVVVVARMVVPRQAAGRARCRPSPATSRRHRNRSRVCGRVACAATD
jgi:hypothetical protein